MLTQLNAPALELAQTMQKELCLHLPTYTLLFIQASFQGLSLKCKQPVTNIPQYSAGGPVLVGWKCKLEPKITYTILEMLITGYIRYNSIAMAKIQPCDM